jgi:hypothetical protein
VYVHLAHEGEATVRELMIAFDILPESAYAYVNRLVDTGVRGERSDS